MKREKEKRNLDHFPALPLSTCPICGKERHPGDMVEGERVWCVWCFDAAMGKIFEED